jgi:Sulfate permease and related transporters (MFS superfamily)
MVGKQIGLGMALGIVSVDLMAGEVRIAAVALEVLALALVRPRWPVALAAVAVAVGMRALLGQPGAELGAGAAWALPDWPTAAEAWAGATQLALPQLALTLTNAVLLTALVAGDHFGARAAHVTPRRLSVTSGLANLVLTPFGAMPMCHGAGGLAAHHALGARTGAAPALLGAALLALALAPLPVIAAVLGAVPEAGLGALLMVAAVQLSASRRLIDGRPSCLPVIAVTAAATLWMGPLTGLGAGWICEVLRRRVLRRLGASA